MLSSYGRSRAAFWARVGPLTGEEPHLLFGHTQPVTSVAVSPDGRWIASSSNDRTIRLWPMPDLSKPPLHTLPPDGLLARRRSLTNLRAVPNPSSDTGWKIEVGPFPGWATVPEWQPQMALDATRTQRHTS